MANSIKLTFCYVGTDSTRTYTIGNVADSIVADTSAIKNKIKAINASLAGGTSGGLNEALRSDDFNAAENIGVFQRIKAAQINETEITPLVLQGGVTNA